MERTIVELQLKWSNVTNYVEDCKYIYFVSIKPVLESIYSFDFVV